MKAVHRKRILICICLILLNLAFIFGNSLLPGQQSAELSNGVLEALLEILDETIPNGTVLVRKAAHFTEFACLGLLLSWLFLELNQKGFHKFTMPLLCGAFTALTDETLQYLVPDRGPGVLDVWIDILGVTAGILLLYLGHWIFGRKNNHPMEETET